MRIVIHKNKKWLHFLDQGGLARTRMGIKFIYYLPTRQLWPLGFLGFWANLGLYGRLLINEATGQVGGYGFGQVLTKHIFVSEHTP